ncbi:YraN family protein [Patescibacteria group bacterium]|nr:YraN family protein [Patescibacteria group bacterium]
MTFYGAGDMGRKQETEKQRIGRIGENVACKFLMKHGFSIVECNYWRKWGEIDIIAQKAKKFHFVEVKTVSRENLTDVTREIDGYRPEENVHPAKLKRLGRTIQTYLLEKNLEDEEWQFDVLAVFLDIKNKEAKVRFTEDVVL